MLSTFSLGEYKGAKPPDFSVEIFLVDIAVPGFVACPALGPDYLSCVARSRALCDGVRGERCCLNSVPPFDR